MALNAVSSYAAVHNPVWMKQKCVQQGPRKKAEMSCTCRAVYPKVSEVGARLIEILHSRHQQGPIDMSEVCMCETIDALGLAGFDKSFHSIEAINQGQRAHLLDVSQRQDKGPRNIMCTMTSCALQLRLVLGSQSLSLHNMAWCCAVLCCAVLCCAVLCCAVNRSASITSWSACHLDGALYPVQAKLCNAKCRSSILQMRRWPGVCTTQPISCSKCYQGAKPKVNCACRSSMASCKILCKR